MKKKKLKFNFISKISLFALILACIVPISAFATSSYPLPSTSVVGSNNWTEVVLSSSTLDLIVWDNGTSPTVYVGNYSNLTSGSTTYFVTSGNFAYHRYHSNDGGNTWVLEATATDNINSNIKSIEHSSLSVHDGSATGPIVFLPDNVDTTPPSDVTNLSAGQITDTSLTLTWTASTSSDVAHYDVYQNNSLIGSTAASNYSVTGLTASTSYNFVVKSVDNAGNVSAGSTYTVSTVASSTTSSGTSSGGSSTTTGTTSSTSDTGSNTNTTNSNSGGILSMFANITSSSILTEATTWANNFNAILLVVVGVGVGFACVRFVKHLFF